MSSDLLRLPLTAQQQADRSLLAEIEPAILDADPSAAVKIYDLRIHHDDILWPLLRYWRVFERSALDAEAEQARERLALFLATLDESARRFEERRATKRDRADAAADLS